MLAVSLSNTTNTVQSYVATVNWSQPTWDVFIVLFFIIAGFLYGLSLGRDRIIVILVSIYMALAVVNTAPYLANVTAEIGVSSLFAVKISTFIAVFIALFILLSRSALLSTIASSDSHGSWWQVLLFSFLHVGLLTSITLSFLPESALDKLAPLTRTLFATQFANFLWILAPIVAMIILKGGAAERKRYKYDI